jgi:hypothetical protein
MMRSSIATLIFMEGGDATEIGGYAEIAALVWVTQEPATLDEKGRRSNLTAE